MPLFEYDVSVHPADTFSDLVYFCTAEGECSANQIPHDQAARLKEILNQHGGKGWELVNILLNRSGVLAIWKRQIDN